MGMDMGAMLDREVAVPDADRLADAVFEAGERGPVAAQVTRHLHRPSERFVGAGEDQRNQRRVGAEMTSPVDGDSRRLGPRRGRPRIRSTRTPVHRYQANCTTRGRPEAAALVQGVRHQGPRQTAEAGHDER